jgi:hypothetical protein
MATIKEKKEGTTPGARRVTIQELEAARQTVRLCSGLSRLELAKTICEHWGWVTASGSHKVTACLNVLEELEQQGVLRLPGKRRMTRWNSDQAGGAVPTQRTNPGALLLGKVSEMASVGLEVVQGKEAGRLWNEYVDRYHYLGYRQPMGCFLRYFIESEAGLLGCILMAGAAKALEARDQWIGWNRARRERNLPWVINNTRLLIFPWVRLIHLSSGQTGRSAGGMVRC